MVDITDEMAEMEAKRQLVLAAKEEKRKEKERRKVRRTGASGEARGS